MRYFKKNTSTEKNLYIETTDDLWVVYQLLLKNDIVISDTTRKVSATENQNNTATILIHTRLKLKVIDYEIDLVVGQLFIRGTVLEGVKGVRIGSHHRFTITVRSKLCLQKETWYPHDLSILSKCISSAKTTELLVVAIQNEKATIAGCYSNGPCVISTVTQSSPGKKSSQKETDNYKEKLMSKIHNILSKHLLAIGDSSTINGNASNSSNKNTSSKNTNNKNTRTTDTNHNGSSLPLVIGGPGMWPMFLQKYIQQHPLTNTSCIILAKCSSGRPEAIEEILTSKDVTDKLDASIWARELDILGEFQKKLAIAPELVAYGHEEVFKAYRYDAISQLFCSYMGLKHMNPAIQSDLYTMKYKLSSRGVKTHLLNSRSTADEILQSLGNVAAILKYSIEDFDD